MDVYVVVNQDIGEPGLVIGAAANLDAAYEIADRSDIWSEGISPSWVANLDTGVHSRRWAGVWQEIVRVPLAGFIEWRDVGFTTDAMPGELPQALTLRSEIQEIGRSFGAP